MTGSGRRGPGLAWEGVSAKRSWREALLEFEDVGGDVEAALAAAKQFGHGTNLRLPQEGGKVAVDKALFGAVIIAAQPGELPMHFAETSPAFFGVRTATFLTFV
ncbi:MAG: hypothetical protein ACLQVX_02400 [Limisphaerales bacterium]